MTKAKGKPKKDAAEEFNLDDEQEQVAQPPAEEIPPEDVAIMQLASEYSNNTDITLRIYREGKTHRDLAFIKEMHPKEFSPSMLQDEPFNGGKFRLYFVSPTGFVANRGINVEPKPAAKNNGAELQGIAAMLAEGFKQLGERIAPAQAPQSRMQFLEEMRMFKEVFQSGSTNAPATSDPLAAIRMIKEFAAVTKEITTPAASVVATNEEGEINPTATMLRLAEKYFGGLMELKQSAAQQVVPQTESASIAAPIVSAQPGQEENEAVIQLRGFAKLLCAHAAVNGDVESDANFILDSVAEEEILGFLNAPDWFEKVCGFAPAASKYKEWFDELRAAILEMTAPETPTVESATLTAEENTGTMAASPVSPAVSSPGEGANVPAKS